MEEITHTLRDLSGKNFLGRRALLFGSLYYPNPIGRVSILIDRDNVWHFLVKRLPNPGGRKPHAVSCGNIHIKKSVDVFVSSLLDFNLDEYA